MSNTQGEDQICAGTIGGGDFNQVYSELEYTLLGDGLDIIIGANYGLHSYRKQHR